MLEAMSGKLQFAVNPNTLPARQTEVGRTSYSDFSEETQ